MLADVSPSDLGHGASVTMMKIVDYLHPKLICQLDEGLLVVVPHRVVKRA
jgi:hypothetical protein